MAIFVVRSRWNGDTVSPEEAALTEMRVRHDDRLTAWPEQRAPGMQHHLLIVYPQCDETWLHPAAFSNLRASRSIRPCQDSVDTICVCKRSAHSGNANGVNRPGSARTTDCCEILSVASCIAT